VTSDVISLLQSYDWPGNVRQLENVLRGVLLFHQRDVLTADDFPPEIFDITLRRDDTSLKNNLNRFERAYIMRVLKEHNGDKRAAAAHLKISLTTLYQKIKDLSIPTPDHS
jgi:transcriptional regulator with PAS, ATPase and Fis domain